MPRWTLTIHHPDSVDDPYEIDSLDSRGPATLGEAVRAEAAILAADADANESAVVTEATRALCGKGRYRDALGVLWTLEKV